MPGANIIGVAYRGKKNLYAENNGWTDIYFFELRKRFSTKTNCFFRNLLVSIDFSVSNVDLSV